MNCSTHYVLIVNDAEKMRQLGVVINGRSLTVPARAHHRRVKRNLRAYKSSVLQEVTIDKYLLGDVFVCVEENFAAWIEAS